MDLHRVRELSPARFLDDHLIPQVPVVVTGEMAGWSARSWTWQLLAERFGHHVVEVYDDWFTATGTMHLSDFVASAVHPAGADPKTSYVRWFSRTRPGPGHWSDDVLDELADDWSQPSFLPGSDYLVPMTTPGQTITAARDRFPYRGLFLSARGARTRMHRDPWASAAALCQLSGSKFVRMYGPDQYGELTAAALAGDLAADTVPPAQSGTLSAGEVIFIPDGWWHQVDTLTDSISLTWNFVHRSVAARLSEYVAAFPADPEFDVLTYFLRAAMPGETGPAADLVGTAIGRYDGVGRPC